LDGVPTATAKVHATAWKRMFDYYFNQRAKTGGEPFRPFDIYLCHWTNMATIEAFV
jgi:hypothetical protein